MIKALNRKRAIGIVLASACVLGVIIFAATYGDYLGARIIGAKGGRISVRQGEVVSLQLPKTSAPSVKIELCQENIKPEKCRLLVNKTSKKVLDATIPLSATLGKATIKVTERNNKGAITNNVLMRRPVLVVKAKPTPAPTTNLSSSSNSSGGGSSGSEGSSSEGAVVQQEEIQRPNITSLCFGGQGYVSLEFKAVKNVRTVEYREVGNSSWDRPVADNVIYHWQDNSYLVALTGVYADTTYEFRFSEQPDVAYRFSTGSQPSPTYPNACYARVLSYEKISL